jgi:feruloyl esterase
VRFLGQILMEKYDAVDGVEDGVIGNPAAIDFDPDRDLPRDLSGRNGFTDLELQGLGLAYGGLVHEGRQLVAGVPIGAELAGQAYAGNDFAAGEPSSAWVNRLVPNGQGSIAMREVMQDWFRYLLLEQDDPGLDWRDIDLSELLSKMEAKRALLSATDPDLSAFRDRGGKLLIYNGWADAGVNPYLIIDYYGKILHQFQQSQRGTDDFVRLFLVPGMFHCRGGLNVDRFDGMTALINWVESGSAPDSIPASRVENGQVTRTRPLCPYPQVIRYDGAGNINQADNFRCGEP